MRFAERPAENVTAPPVIVLVVLPNENEPPWIAID